MTARPADRAVTVADVEALRSGDVARLGDGTEGEAALCAPAASHASEFPVSGWPAERCDGLMIRDRAAGIMDFDRTGFEDGNVAWASEGVES